ncbi:peptide MFS transporter [Teredinibacter waterburyi]|jgi:amino acid/peptide transporter (Peptide:H+ symporter), bacterial|uniref:peptide MFS transporter n=1 Tax=Teredinibacter waterburyi TaxID=1500538 RepID=UPI00165F4D57|nr:peptide MFS transporter [Teredinibacter waterburyi]
MTTSVANSGEFLGHPKGLYVCFTTELWERFSFYGMKYLLLLYVTKYHLFSDNAGYDILGAYAGLVYALPLIGGLIADRYLGMRKAVVFGAILLTLGHATMTYEGAAAVSYAAGSVLETAITLNDGSIIAAGTVLTERIVVQDVIALKVFFFALALITLGVGFLKPNISVIVGRLYPQDDPRQDSGYTIFYMGINIGSFIATLLCGWLGETYGWSYGFGAAGIGMAFGLVTFLYGQKYLQGHAEPPAPEKLKTRGFGPLNQEWTIYAATLASLALVWWVVQREPVVHIAQNSMLIVAIVGLILYALSQGTTKQRPNLLAWIFSGFAVVSGLAWAITGNDLGLGLMLLGLVCFIGYGFKINKSPEYSRTVVLMFLIVSTVVFWSLFEQSAGSMTLYADRVLDRDIAGTSVKASMFGSLNAGFIMLLAIPFAILWTWLGRKNMEPSTPVKFGLAIIQVGLGFGALVLGAQFADDAGKVAMIWLVLAYLLHTTGEICISPVGLSAVSKLSIGNVVGVSMGTWFLATALSETLATRIGKLASIDTSHAASDALTMLTTYTELYTFLMWLGLGVGVFVLALSPLLKRGMRGIH